MNYFEVHKNKKPKQLKLLKNLRFQKALNALAQSASNSFTALLSFEYSMSKCGEIGQIVCFADSSGGNM